MSSDRLREAARVLRERAEAATPGPWNVTNWRDCVWASRIPATAHTAERRPERVAQMHVDGPNASFIATMHPGVALAVADLLDHEAGLQDRVRLNTFANVRNGAAYALADAILGGTK